MRTFKARRSWRAFILRRQTTFGASPHGRQDLAARPEVHRGRFSTVLLDLELDLLTFVERAQSGALDGGDVHEDIPASICGLNETIALLRVEPLHRSARHCRILRSQRSGIDSTRPGALKLRSVDNSRLLAGCELDRCIVAQHQGVDHG